MIPDEVIAAILSHHDIVEVVGKYVHLTKRGRNMIGLCPFHSEKTPSFTVSSEKQIFNCFGCGVGGNVIKFVMEIEGYSFREALSQLAEDANVPITWQRTSYEGPRLTKEQEMLMEAHELCAQWFHYVLKNSENGMAAMAYLRQRGMNDQLIDTFQIGYAPPLWDSLTKFLEKRGFDLPLLEQGGLLVKRTADQGFVDRFRDRIMFPIIDEKGKVIAFAGRVFQGDEQPKYLNSPETAIFNKSSVLYNFHMARAGIRKSRTAILFEGYADVIKAWEAGIRNGVATMGTALTEQHVHTLRRNADQVIICYDGDEAGQMAAFHSLALLEKHRLQASVVVLPDQRDPDDYIDTYGAQSFIHYIERQALSAMMFKLEHMKTRFQLHTDQGQLNYIEAAIQMIAPLPLPTEREHYLHHIVAQFDYSYESLKQQLDEARQNLQKKRKQRDNNENTWNNVMNERRASVNTPALLPAYHNAERQLLCFMMHNRHIADIVQEELADQFNVDVHIALAAHIYSYYSKHEEANISHFIAMIEDDELQGIASAISMLDIDHNSDLAIIKDYINYIKNVHMNKQLLAEKRLEMKRAERAGQLVLAAQIATDINTLERKLKLRGTF